MFRSRLRGARLLFVVVVVAVVVFDDEDVSDLRLFLTAKNKQTRERKD